MDWIWVVAGIAAFTAGLMDAAVGGGGLIQIPALFGIFPKEIPASLLGTNKVSSAFGVSMASYRFARKVTMPWAITFTTMAASFTFSMIGTSFAQALPAEYMRPIVVTLLLIVAIQTLLQPKLGTSHEPKQTGKKALWLAACIGALIGGYDGFFGPGTGTFFIFAFVRIFGFDFLHASANAKLANLASNIGSIILFGLTGHVLWLIALPMAVCNLIGAYVGSHLAIRYGSKLIRKLFLVLVFLLIGKMIFDMLK